MSNACISLCAQRLFELFPACLRLERACALYQRSYLKDIGMLHTPARERCGGGGATSRQVNTLSSSFVNVWSKVYTTHIFMLMHSMYGMYCVYACCVSRVYLHNIADMSSSFNSHIPCRAGRVVCGENIDSIVDATNIHTNSTMQNARAIHAEEARTHARTFHV